ncbi:MAG: ABC transporter permease, partial [Clostridium sp.]
VGIYKSSSELNDNAMRNNAMNPYNKIYSSYTFVNTIKGADSGDIDRSEFYVNDPVNVDSVLENAKKLDIDFDTFKLDANNGEYEKMMGPIENVGSFANSTVVIVSIAGAIILGLIIMLWIKDRKNEIGILLSLGESKFKIISQFAVEVLIILVLSLGVAGIIGNAVSSKLGEVLVQKEISSLSENNKTNDYMMGPNGMGGDFKGDRNNQNVETIDKLDVNVSISDLSKMVGISLMISFLAIAIPSIGIMRLEPKEILSKHN